MKILEYISQQHIVTTDEISQFVKSDEYVSQIINRYVKKGYLQRIRRGLFVSNYGYYKNKPVNPFEIIYKLDPNTILCLHSSLEINGVAHNQFSDYRFYTNKNYKKFQYESFNFIPMKFSETTLTKTSRINEDESMLVTSTEQTIVDCLKRPWLAGGSEEVLRSLLGYMYIDYNIFESILPHLNVSLISKLGWFLEINAEKWNVSSKLIIKYEKNITQGPYYFNYQDSRQVYYDKKWKLYLPFSKEEIQGWIT